LNGYGSLESAPQQILQQAGLDAIGLVVASRIWAGLSGRCAGLQQPAPDGQSHGARLKGLPFRGAARTWRSVYGRCGRKSAATPNYSEFRFHWFGGAQSYGDERHECSQCARLAPGRMTFVSNSARPFEPVPGFGKVDDIVPSYVFLASDEARFCQGQCISPNGGDIFLLKLKQ